MAPSLTYLSRADVEAAELPMSEIIEALAAMFVDKGHGRVEMPPKPGIHTLPDAFIHAMPAWIPGLRPDGPRQSSGRPPSTSGSASRTWRPRCGSSSARQRGLGTTLPL